MSGTTTDKRILELITFASVHGNKATCEHFGIADSTLRRRKRDARERGLEVPALENKYLKEIEENYTDEEIKTIARGGRVMPGMDKIPRLNFDGDTIKFGAMSDTHMGSIYFQEYHYFKMLEEFDKEGVSFITHSGDVTEGFSRRPGHVYELSKIGYDQQKEYAVDLLSNIECPLFMIDGNHDRWYIQASGSIIVKDIADALPNAQFLGHDEGDIAFGPTTLKLWHGLDGNSYAISYRVQKLVESLSGGEKPGIIIAGHVHKQGYNFLRNIHCISAGSVEMQTKWMRGKRLEAHTGFWIIQATVNDVGIAKFTPTWYPFYA